jgi:lipopolysaccharide transport system ATP-binding protein
MGSLSVRGVGKRYRHSADRPRTWKEAAIHGFRQMRGGAAFWALRGVSFDVPSGKTFGLVGPNGSGKSTLLRLIGGVGRPDEGRIDVDGRVAAIFELGAGFHHDLTGRESVLLAGVICGLTRREVASRFDEIVGFAELEAFIDDHIRTYSSGMVARLGFSIATHVDADVLLVDEVLAVGDLAFQERCMNRLRAFQRAGVTMVIVSHEPALLAGFCDEVLWLLGGTVVAAGRPDEVTDRYRAAMEAKARELTPADVPVELTQGGIPLRIHDNRIGSQEGRLAAVTLMDRWARTVSELSSGDPLTVECRVELDAAVSSANLGLHLVRVDDGVLCFDASTRLLVENGGPLARVVRLSIDRLDLAPGNYEFEVGLYSGDWDHPYDYHWQAYPLRVTGDGGGGVLHPPVRWTEEIVRGASEA